MSKNILFLMCAWLGVLLLPPIIVFVQILRLQLWPVRMRRVATPAKLTPDQAATAEELIALGFVECTEYDLEIGPRHYATLLFRHSELPVFADLTLQARPATGYPIVFYSFDADGTMLATVNRIQWVLMGSPPNVKVLDPYADSLSDHWQAHKARLSAKKAVVYSDEEAQRRILEFTEGHLPLLQERHLCAQTNGAWHPTVRGALHAVIDWFRVRRKIARRYVSAVTTGPYQSAYFSRCYAESESTRLNRPSRRHVKASLLILTFLGSLLVWSLAYNGFVAVALVTILLVHESGHALAMRAFGYRDMSMFFIPFVGAMVTGSPKDIPAWKQAIVLLAGPVPGLLVGMVLMVCWAHPPSVISHDWRIVASMALYVNFFNLLPMTPLDGGRLVELSLFSRWPRLRLLFAMLSAAAMIGLAVWIKQPVAGLIAMVLVLGLRSQWRISKLQQGWRGDLNPDQQVEHLFEAARTNWPAQPFARQYPLIRSVFLQRAVRIPQLWESLLIVSVMLSVWGAAGISAYQLQSEHWTWVRHHAAPAQNESEAALVAAGTPKAWALATDAMTIQDNGMEHLRLGGWRRVPDVEDSYDRVLSRDWGIDSRSDLLKELSWLEEHGQREQFEKLGRYADGLSPQAYSAALKKLNNDVHAQHRLQVAREHHKALGDKSLLGWDMVRYVTLCRWGYLVGYLSENEAWEHITKAALRVHATFGSWQDLADNFLLGREFWNWTYYQNHLRNSQQIYQQLLHDPHSPWVLNPWDIDLQNEAALATGQDMLVPSSSIDATKLFDINNATPQELRSLAEQGDTRAEEALGAMYIDGQGMPQDDTVAATWYRKAADHGDSYAQDYLGWMYEKGRGVPQDLKAAAEWYRKAAVQGYDDAQFRLGLSYNHGVGVQQDYATAMVWYQKAAAQGHAGAQNNIGVLYERGQGVRQNYKAALAWYRKAVKERDPLVEGNIGWIYENGLGVPHDDRIAVRWYRRAAAQGSAYGQTDLGELYKTTLPMDPALAVKWFRKAAAQGNTNAEDSLGLMYQEGKGVAENAVIAYALFNLSATSEPSQQHYGAKPHDGVTHRESLKRLLSSAQISAGESLTQALRLPGNFLRALDQPYSGDTDAD